MAASPAASFVEGLAKGYGTVQGFQHADAREKRAQEEHGQVKRIRELGIGRMEKEQPVLDKELQVRGAKADFDLSEQQFKSELQAFEQETRKLLADNQQRQARIQSGELQAQQTNQPDELGVKRAELQDKVFDSIQRQTANMWRVMRFGNKNMALEMFNNSQLVMPGEKGKDFRIEEADGQGPDGKPAKVEVLAVDFEGKAGTKRLPVAALEQLENQYGARYEKSGNDIVRIGRDGKVTQVYQGGTEVDHIPDSGDLYVKKGPGVGTRLPAAGGVGGAGATPAPGSRAAGRVDDRVKMAIDKVIMPRYGGRFEGGLFFPDEANKEVATRATQIAGELVRGGMDPEAAGTRAIQHAEREKALKPGGASGGNPAGYAGPTPWKR